MASEQNYEQATKLKSEEKKIGEKLDKEKEKWYDTLGKTREIVSVDDVYEMVTNMTKIPISKMDDDESEKLLKLQNNLSSVVIGQNDAIDIIVKSIYRSRIGIKDPNKPISYIFLGSTGVGKTYLAKQLAKELFGSTDNLIRFDMSEFQEKHTISRLFGAPPGYVGYEEGGQLTEKN